MRLLGSANGAGFLEVDALLGEAVALGFMPVDLPCTDIVERKPDWFLADKFHPQHELIYSLEVGGENERYKRTGIRKALI